MVALVGALRGCWGGEDASVEALLDSDFPWPLAALFNQEAKPDMAGGGEWLRQGRAKDLVTDIRPTGK